MLRSRYAMLTVDTEALPKRAPCDHVNRLIWGRHDAGQAGIRELCSIGDDFHVKHVFFVDMCATYQFMDEMKNVVRWLHHDAGQDVQLHAHPEVLPPSFWSMHGLNSRPSLMNEYLDDARAEFILRHFSETISEVTGLSIRAFRAGSFRWNSSVIRALKKSGISLSFNNSMRALEGRRCVFSEPTNSPYLWSNGILEIPVTERLSLPQAGGGSHWVSLTYPESSYFRFSDLRTSWFSRLWAGNPSFAVFLMHSWSLLYWDENGHATYRDDQRLEGYRKLLSKLTKDYDVITTRDFLDLHARGKIPINHTVDIEKAAYRK